MHDAMPAPCLSVYIDFIKTKKHFFVQKCQFNLLTYLSTTQTPAKDPSSPSFKVADVSQYLQ